MSKKTQNLDEEQLWYHNDLWAQKNHFLQRWPFAHRSWHAFAYKYMRENARQTILNYKFQHKIKRFDKALVAPCGTAADQDILSGIANKFYGIDVSSQALKSCPKNIITKKADILKSGYDKGYFDFIGSFLFFHHVHRVGFEPFLKEFNRILKNDGILVILEPSSLYPVSWFMGLGRKIFGNVSGQVPDEAPLSPMNMNIAIKNSGFKIERFESLSYSHVRMPILIQNIMNRIFGRFRKTNLLGQVGWMVVWICKKV